MAPGARMNELRVYMRLDGYLQLAIAGLSIAAIYLVAGTHEYARWGFVVGLASQPFWIAATWRARQWGMLTVSLAYTPAWIGGIAARFF